MNHQDIEMTPALSEAAGLANPLNTDGSVTLRLKGENQAYEQLSTHGTVIFTTLLSGSCIVSAI